VLTVLLGGLLVAIVTVGAIAWALPVLVRRIIRIILSRPMSDTLAELYLSLRSTPAMDFLYSSLRAETGDIVIRPMGSARPSHGLDDVALVPAQLATAPLLDTEPVDLTVAVGRARARPLKSSLPIYISGMAYGLALTRETRLALAMASGRARVPLNSGQGPFLAEERRLADTYILQFGRWAWNRDLEILAQADMIEIQVGQGAMPGNAVLATPGEVGPEVRQLMGLAPGESPTIHARLFLTDPAHPASLDAVVAFLRREAPDVPLAVKMGAGQSLEADMDVCLEAGVDAIVIDGTEGATGNAPITLSDHFGIPTLMALVRAVRHLERRQARGRVALLVSGGFREPGDMLKALALGADMVGIGTIAMFAVAHRQITKAVPFFPPTDLVFYRSRPHLPLDPEQGARGLANFLESCRREMTIAMRAMGKRRLADLTPKDLTALDPVIADLTALPYAGASPPR
jgi:glutamate synthase domain-containing protein 2